MKRKLLLTLFNLALVLGGVHFVDAQGTAFTYQGKLTDDCCPATGDYDLTFKVFDSAGPGSSGQQGANVALTHVPVTNGLFTVSLDFGSSVFTGAQRWLQIDARTNNMLVTPVTLLPRTELTPTPYALYAKNAGGVVDGGITATALAPSPMNGKVLSYNNGNLQWTGPSATTGWSLSGNNIAPGQFLGTLNPEPLELRVNNFRVLRLEPVTVGGLGGGFSPNLIGGSSGNTVESGIFSATIGGGGNPVSPNRVTGSRGTVSGGEGNIAGASCAVGGGIGNRALGFGCAIAGGENNWTSVLVDPSNRGSAVGGGLGNYAVGPYATIPGGHDNFASGSNSFAAGLMAKAYHDGTFVWADVSGPDFASSGANQFLIRASGGVGIGTTSPSRALEVQSSGDAEIGLKSTDAGGRLWTIQSSGNVAGNLAKFQIIDRSAQVSRFTITPDGNIGVGTTGPTQPLDVQARQAAARFVTVNDINGSVIELKNISGSPGLLGAINFNDSAESYSGQIAYTAGGDMAFRAGGIERMRIAGNGTVTVPVLTITGGADLAEPFQMSSKDIPKGALVIIDEENPGQLKKSERAYDTRVAGIVSGANGIKPGISLHQEGALEGTDQVALTGRVYALADASHGPIKPGDLLTTSATPGHCMKVTDHAKAQGAIIGKAMSSLASGQGHVLVLVSLQ